MITITHIAAEKVLKNLKKREKGHGIRIGIRTTGCSGLAYTLEYVDTILADDICFVSEVVQIFVDPKSLPYLTGITLDWARNGLNEGFEFINPNSKGECGCGESFRV